MDEDFIDITEVVGGDDGGADDIEDEDCVAPVRSGLAHSSSAAARAPAPAREPSGVSLPAASKRKRVDPEAAAAAKTIKQQEKADAKAEKLRLQAQVKADKKAIEVAERSARGGYAKTEIGISLEASFAASEVGAAIAAGVTEYSLLPATVSPIANSIFWRRRKVDASRLGAGFMNGVGTLEPFAAVWWKGETYVEALVAHGTDVMEEAVTAMRAALPPGTRVLFIIEGAAEYIGRRMKAADAARRRGAVPPPTVTQDGYDAANMHLYVTVELEAKETTSTADTVDYLQGLTRAIAEYPYRMQPNALAVVTKVKVQRTFGGSAASSSSSASAAAGAGGEDDDDEGGGAGDSAAAGAGSAGRKGAGKRAADDDRLVVSTYQKNLTETWMAQLQMIPGVSAVKAAAIVARFPTLRSLVDRYRDPALPQAVKEGLLEEAMLDRSGKRMGKLSRDVYRFFTTRDPEELIGAAAGK